MAEDIISTLPDPILCHILSFLETKESVATSILSKRWKYLWLSVTTLYFTNTMGADENTHFRFNDSVYSVLLSRDPALSIKTFRLEVVYNFNPHNRSSHSVFKWVNFVLQRGVEYLHLNWSLLCLPISILNCRTLVVLKLSSGAFNGAFKVEVGFSSVALPSLKTLHLENIWFSKVRDYMLIIRGCPILEDLFASNLSVMHSDESLTSEEWKSFCLSNLTKADIDYTCSHFLLKAVQYVRSLRSEINQVEDCIDSIPTFHNLTQLVLTSYCDWHSLCRGWQFLVELLNHCSRLQKFDVDQTDTEQETFNIIYDEDDVIVADNVPQCLSLHLRTCNLLNLSLQGKLMLARYILKNARVLQTMTIWKRGQPKIKSLLSSCPRASATCKLIFQCKRQSRGTW